MRTALLVGLLFLAAQAVAEIGPGTTLDSTNADEAKDLLPPEVYEHYKKGEYHNVIVDFPNAGFEWDDGYAEASNANRENLTLDAQGPARRQGDEPAPRLHLRPALPRHPRGRPRPPAPRCSGTWPTASSTAATAAT